MPVALDERYGLYARELGGGSLGRLLLLHSASTAASSLPVSLGAGGSAWVSSGRRVPSCPPGLSLGHWPWRWEKETWGPRNRAASGQTHLGVPVPASVGWRAWGDSGLRGVMFTGRSATWATVKGNGRQEGSLGQGIFWGHSKPSVSGSPLGLGVPRGSSRSV